MNKLFIPLMLAVLPAAAVTIFTAEERAERAEYAAREALEKAPLVVVVRVESSFFRKQALPTDGREMAEGMTLCRYSAIHSGQVLELWKGALPCAALPRFEWPTEGVAEMPPPTAQEEQGVEMPRQEEDRVLVITRWHMRGELLVVEEITPLMLKSAEKLRALLPADPPQG